jgi:protoporphyrinogen/coproporphyrinogen III oxidase
MIERCAIIGAGISGLSAAYFLQRRFSAVSIDLFESTARVGGVIRSEKISGCIVEGGPDSFLTIKKPASVLGQALGLERELVGSNDHARKTYIYDDGELKELPDGFFLMVPTRLQPLLSTNLLSWPGKLDALSDLFCESESEDCAVADFLQRRFGNEVLQKIGEPMISGIYGADVRRLSLKSALPQVWEMQKKGSLILQLIRRGRARHPEALFTTFENGMESLIGGLQKRIRLNLKLNQAVDAVTRTNGKWRISDEGYDAVVIAGSRLPLLEIPEYSRLESLWSSIKKNSAVVTVLAFEGLQRNGFGWLVPESQRKSILACTYVSNKFPRRSPENLFLIRTFIGGNHATAWISRSDEEIRKEVLQELNRIAGIDADPVFCRIFRWHNAMPEYRVNHSSKIESIRNLIRLQNGLYLTGNIFSGVGIPDCIQHSEKIVSEM